MATDFSPSRSARAFWGQELRRLREEAGLSQDALGKLLFCSAAYVGQLETAVRNPQGDMSRRLDEILKTGGHFLRVYEMYRKASRYAEYFEHAAELQSMALTISEFSPLLVPGLLQTRDYARSLFESAQPLRKAAENEEMVAARLARSELLDRQNAPMYWAVLDEAVIRRPVGGAWVMAGQLRHLAGLVRARKALLQIVPFATGAHALMDGSLCLMTFDDAPPTAYAEGPGVGTLVDEPSLVGTYSRAYDLVRAAALSPEASLALIESAAEGYEDAANRAVAQE
ncbi:Scr1 family TA system antitoxin-like transcriptional regulator [Kitasatospora sp. NPDC057500]|uniref:helix-turn-helix domain-containing protein n=1 Tax=Kitasatospora sp. NPDC057500 TaxID=3346151 RepID=UPI0036BD712E